MIHIVPPERKFAAAAFSELGSLTSYVGSVGAAGGALEKESWRHQSLRVDNDETDVVDRHERVLRYQACIKTRSGAVRQSDLPILLEEIAYI